MLAGNYLIIISILFMYGYLVILTVAPELYINTVPLPTKRLKSTVRLSSDKIEITAFRKRTKGTDALGYFLFLLTNLRLPLISSSLRLSSCFMMLSYSSLVNPFSSGYLALSII